MQLSAVHGPHAFAALMLTDVSTGLCIASSLWPCSSSGPSSHDHIWLRSTKSCRFAPHPAQPLAVHMSTACLLTGCFLGQACEEMHDEQGFFHRDLKLENLMVKRSPKTKLLSGTLVDWASSRHHHGGCRLASQAPLPAMHCLGHLFGSRMLIKTRGKAVLESFNHCPAHQHCCIQPMHFCSDFKALNPPSHTFQFCAMLLQSIASLARANTALDHKENATAEPCASLSSCSSNCQVQCQLQSWCIGCECGCCSM